MPPMRCCSKAHRSLMHAASARPRSSNARKAKILVYGSSSAGSKQSCRRPMARTVPEDPFCGIADPAEIAQEWPGLDMVDPEEPSAEVLIERARAAEEAALAVKGVTNSEGAEAG